MVTSRELQVSALALLTFLYLAWPQQANAQPEPLRQEEDITSASPEFESEAEWFESDFALPTPTPRSEPTFEEIIEQQHVAYAHVLTIISGDTFRLANGYKVRLVGVQSPPRPRQEDEDLSLGEQAYEFARQLLRGRLIKLAFDQRRKLEDGTLLAYVFLPDGTLVNEDILLEGLAIFDPAQELYEEMAERLRKAQARAQRFHRGIWKGVEAAPLRTPAIPALPREATPQELLPTELPTVEAPPVMPDKIVLITGEEIEGKIIGDLEGSYITLETAEGNVIAVLRRRISEIRKK